MSQSKRPDPTKSAAILIKQLNSINQLISLYSQTYFTSHEALQFQPLLKTVDETIHELGHFIELRDFDEEDMNTLLTIVGMFLKNTFCYLFNCWFRHVYIPQGRLFVSVVFDDAVIRTMMSVQRRDEKLVNAFLDLSRWFLEPVQAGVLEKSFKTTVNLATSRANNDAKKFKKLGQPEPFSKFVLPRFKEFQASILQLELSHQVSDEIDAFLTILRDLFHGPLPPCYRAGNFTLDVTLSHLVIETNTYNPDELDKRFPCEPELQPEQNTVNFDCQDVKRWMRERFKEEFEARHQQIRRELKEILKPQFPLPAGALDSDAYRNDRRLLRHSLRKRRKRTIKKIRKQAESQEAELQERIQEAKAQSRVVKKNPAVEPELGCNDESALQRRDSLTAQIDEKFRELAEIEEETKKQFTNYHSVLLRIRDHIPTEASVIKQLRRKYGVPGIANADETALCLESGTSLQAICEQFEKDWERLCNA